MIFHHNFGVSEHDDPMDGLLLDTVAKLKHPPRIPVEDEPERVSADQLESIRRLNPSLGVSSSEGFIEG